MNILIKYLRRTTPKQGTIKWKAHAATVATCALIVPSLCAVYFWHAGIKEAEPYWVWASITLWRAHAVIAAITLLLWFFEKTKPTNYLPAKDGAVWRALGEIHPSLPIIGLGLLTVFFGWLTVSRFELAYNAWRWELPGRTVGHAIAAIPLLLLTFATAVGPVAWAYLRLRKAFRGTPNPSQAPEPTLPKQPDASQSIDERT